MIFKHPLFWKEWKTAKWWSGLISAMFLIAFLSIGQSLSRHQERILGPGSGLSGYIQEPGQGGVVLEPIFLGYFNNAFEVIVLLLIPVIVIMSIMLFQSERKEGVGMFINSLPFTKRDQFKVKWGVGVLTFTIPFLLATLLTIIMRQVNISWIQQWYSSLGFDGIFVYDSLGLAVRILAQSYLFIVAFFSMLMLMQSLIANNIAASIIGAIVVAVPWFILEVGLSTFSRIFNNTWRLYDINWANLYYFMTPNRDNFIMAEFGKKEIHINPIISKEYFISKIIILIIISLIATFAGFKFYEKNDTSRNGYLLMFPWTRRILIPGFALCSGLLGNNFIKLFISIESAPAEIITLVISALIGWLIMTKIINLSEKHGG